MDMYDELERTYNKLVEKQNDLRNGVVDKIREFNAGNDNLVILVETVLKQVSRDANNKTKNYLKFRLMELYLDLSLMFVNNAIRKSSEYQELHSYYQSDLAFYLEAATQLKRYIKKCQKTGDVDHLDSAYLMSISLSTVLYNLSCYVDEINKITGDMMGNFAYASKTEELRERASKDIEEIKKLMKNIEEE